MSAIQKQIYRVGLMVAFFCGQLLAGTTPVPWDMEELYQVPGVTVANEFTVAGMQSFFYEGITYEGRPTRVYAYYKAPPGTPPEGGWPAVVCVHGGGGTAFPKWVQKWVDHGYAAIAMDLEGHLPDLGQKDRERSGFDGSGPSRAGFFFKLTDERGLAVSSGYQSNDQREHL